MVSEAGWRQMGRPIPTSPLRNPVLAPRRHPRYSVCDRQPATTQRGSGLRPSTPRPGVPGPGSGLGRDEIHAGDMWTSNSVISWLLERSGISIEAIQPPPGGRAAGWQAGLIPRHVWFLRHRRRRRLHTGTHPKDDRGVWPRVPWWPSAGFRQNRDAASVVTCGRRRSTRRLRSQHRWSRATCVHGRLGEKGARDEQCVESDPPRRAVVEVGSGGIHDRQVAEQPPVHLTGLIGVAVETADRQRAELGPCRPDIALGRGVDLHGPEAQPAPDADRAFHLQDDRSRELGSWRCGVGEPTTGRLGKPGRHGRIETCR